MNSVPARTPKISLSAIRHFRWEAFCLPPLAFQVGTQDLDTVQPS